MSSSGCCTFCAMISLCEKKGGGENDKVSFEFGILNFQYILNQKYLTQLILLLIDIVSSFGSRISHSAGFLPASLVTCSRPFLLIRMPHNSFLGSLLFPTCISLKIASILTVLNTSYARDSQFFIPSYTPDSFIQLPT